jgi:hypothetical protein
MAIAYDNHVSNEVLLSGSTVDVSFSLTVGSGSDRSLVVVIRIEDTGADITDISSCSYNSVAMTNGVTAFATAGGRNRLVSIWYLDDPASGAHDVAFTVNSATSGAAVTLAYAVTEQQWHGQIPARPVIGTECDVSFTTGAR